MPTIFETITAKLPKPTEEQKQELAKLEQPEIVTDAKAEELPLKDLVVRWQKKPTPEDTAYILHKMKPTINSAMTSYAPGHQNDLAIKAANLTLNALKAFDPDRGVDPTTFVFHNLKRLNRYANRRANIIPISEKASQEYNFLQQVKADFIDTFDREPSDMELADRTGYSLKKVVKLLDGNKVTSESSTLNPENGNSTQFQSGFNDEDFIEYVYRSVGPIDQKILEWSSGLHGRKVLSNKEIAAKLHLTPAAISQRRGKLIDMVSEVRGML